MTNHFRVKLEEDQKVFHYDVRIEDSNGLLVDKVPSVKARKIVDEAIRRGGEELAGAGIAYDGWKNLYITDVSTRGRGGY